MMRNGGITAARRRFRASGGGTRHPGDVRLRSATAVVQTQFILSAEGLAENETFRVDIRRIRLP